MQILCKVVFATTITTFLTACGGGGGGSSSGTTPTGSNYSGLSTAVSISSGNADDVSGMALENAPIYSTSVSNPQPAAPVNTLLENQQVIKHLAAIAVEESNNAAPNTSKAVHSTTINGDTECGGSMIMSLDLSDSTQEIQGFSVEGNHYGLFGMGGMSNCTYLDGSLSLEQTGNTFTLTYDDFTYSNDSSSSYSTDGKSVMTFGDAEVFWTLWVDDIVFSPITITITSNLTINIDGNTYRFDDLTITETKTSTAGSSEISINGRFYHPDHGYADITTPETLLYSYRSDEPFYGSISFTGEGNSNLTLTFSGSSYNVDLDEDGDGIAESTANGCTSTIEACLGIE
ncbi:MAG: hypothetical protein K6L73_07940 [Cellvibrionaceae bacterium]